MGAYIYGVLNFACKAALCVIMVNAWLLSKPGVSFQYCLFYCRRHEYTLGCPFLAHEVLTFALSRLKDVACEATHQLQWKLNRYMYLPTPVYSLGVYFCVGACKWGKVLHWQHRCGCLFHMGAYFVRVPIIPIIQY